MSSFVSPLISILTGRRSAWAVTAAGLIAAALIASGGGSLQANNAPTAGLPRSAQSTAVARLQRSLPSGQTSPALIVYSRLAGPLGPAEIRSIRAQLPQLRRIALHHSISPLTLSANRAAALVSVPLAAVASSTEIAREVTAIRRVARVGLPAGVRAQVTGSAGFTADLNHAFSGANVTLLLVTVLVVAALLLITYRSPILWLIPLLVVGLADLTTSGLVAWLSRHSGLAINQATTGIVEVLVFGAGTDYALLLIARYREELWRSEDRRQAMGRALRGAAPAILASGATVILALLTLLLARLGSDQAIGVASAVGVATALAFGMIVLPAALVCAPRTVFWPLVPRYQGEPASASEHRGRLWRRVGRATAHRPIPVIVTVTLLLVVMVAGLSGVHLGLSQAQTFRTSSESVAGLRTLARSFPAGAADPVIIVTRSDRLATVRRAAGSVAGVARVTPAGGARGLAQLNADLAAAPGTPASFAAVRRLRRTLAAVPGADARVGGSVAIELDTRNAALRDLRVIAPVILLVVAAVLLVLLRSLVAALLLIVTVILSFGAAIGAGSWFFTHVLGYAGLDVQVPLLSFLFLVALGIDYNIFLTTRAREETATHGTRAGIVEALAATGGVITSAGILLAAVFTVLGVLPVTVLTEIGIIVGIGVLLDTLLVRTVLVPALVHVLGDRFWWPGRLPR